MAIITDEQRRKTKLLFGARMEKARSFYKAIGKAQEPTVKIPDSITTADEFAEWVKKPINIKE